MITRIELVNFMSHEHTVIEPSNGLTVLVGPNNCGKSAVVAALQILAHNDPSTHVMRHGERETRITVRTSDGHQNSNGHETDHAHEITWRRSKSGSPNYTLDGKLFDRLNRQVPDEVRQALRLNKVTAGAEGSSNEFDLHFGEQKAPVFLIDLPNTQAAQFFASSSDAVHLVEMQRRHKLRIRDARKDRERAEVEQAAVQSELEMLEPLHGIETRISALEELHGGIQAREQELAGMETAAAELQRAGAKLAASTARREVLDPLSAPPPLEDSRDLERICAGMETLSQDRARAHARAEGLAELRPMPKLEDADALASLLGELALSEGRVRGAAAKVNALTDLQGAPALDDTARLEELARMIAEVEERRDELHRATARVSQVATELEGAQDELRAWAEAHESCPTCGAPLSADRLMQLFEAGRGDHAHGH